MVGDFENEENKGIIPRAFDYIFQKLKENNKNEKNDKFEVSISFIQIYLEMIQDLFEPSNEVKIRENPEKGVFLEGVKWIKVKSTNECFENFKNGEKNRATAFTEMNAHSSRSHALLITKINKSYLDNNSTEHIMTESYLYLVDLAGSERVNKTNSKDDRLKEARKINFSLLVLGNCIQKLTDPRSTFVSYRDSKLTRILQESLGGNAKTSLIVTISPSNYNCDESISSLNFGARAMKVTNKPQVNKTEDYQAQCFKLQEDYDKLMSLYSKLKIEYEKVCNENNKLKNGDILVELQKMNIKNHINNHDGLINQLFQNNNEKCNFGNFDKKNYFGKLNPEQEKQINLLIEDNEKLKNDLKKLENFYQKKEASLEEEKQNLLRDLDKYFRVKEDEYEEQIKNLSLENNILKNKVTDLQKDKEDLTKENEELQNSYNDTLNRNYELKKDFEEYEKKITLKTKNINENENQILKLNNELKELSNNLKEKENEIKELKGQVEIIENKTEENKQSYNKELSNIKTDYKLLTVNSKSTDSELKRIQNYISSCEKILSKQITYLNNDLSNLSKMKKGVKIYDTIVENDLSTIFNSKNSDNILNKLKKQLLNNQNILEEYQNNNNQNSQIINGDLNFLIEKLSEFLKENKNTIFYLLNSYFKICKELYDTYKNRIFNKLYDNDKGNDLGKKNLLNSLKDNLDKYGKFVYNGKINDLKEKVTNTLNNYNKYNSSEINNLIIKIIDDLIMRISSCKSEQQLEIENLNEKVIYFLREIEIYKKNEQSNNITEKYDKLISLKEQEINRLNKVINNNLEKIKELSTQNYFNSDSMFSSFSNLSINQEEAKLKLVQNEKDIDELSKELEKIEAQQREIEQKQSMRKFKK